MENENANVESENACNISQSSKISTKAKRGKRKRKLSPKLEDEKIKTKRRKVIKLHTDKYEQCHSINGENTVELTKRIGNNFPINKIRNGTFDQLLEVKVLLKPLPPEILSTRHSINLNNINIDGLSNKEMPFVILSPSKKNGGKSFKNRTITSYFTKLN